MQTQTEKIVNVLKEAKSQFYLTEFDLNLSEIKSNRLLEWNKVTIGYIVIEGDVFYLKLYENAPKLVVSDFPQQKQVLIEAANTVKIKQGLYSVLENLQIEADSIEYQTNTNVSNEIKLLARDSLIISGPLDAEKIYCEAASFTNDNKLEGKQILSILADKIEQNGELASKALLLKGNAIVMHEKSRINVEERSVFIANSALLNGELKTGANLICKIDDLTIASPFNELKDAYIAATTIHLQKTGSLEWTPNRVANQIEASKIIVDKDAKLKLNKTIISGAEIHAQGEVTLEKCHLNIKNLDFQGNYSISNSICSVEKSAILSGDNCSILKNIEFEAEHIVFSGENKNQNVNFISDDILFTAGNRSAFTDCSLNVQNIISLNEKAQTEFNDSFINVSALYFSGKASLEDCIVESDRLKTSEQTSINSCTILAAEFWQDAGAKIYEGNIKAQATTLQNKVDIQHSELRTNTFTHTGTGKVEESTIYVFDYIHTSKDSNLTFKHSYLESRQNYSQGILNLTDGSNYKCSYLQQSAGSITVNGSNLKNDKLIYTFDGAQLASESKANVQVKTALFGGNNDWNTSELKATGPIVLGGKTTGDNASITSQDSIYLSKNQHQLNKTDISSQKDILVNGDLTLINQSKLGCSRLTFSGQNNQIENSQIDASDLAILKHFSSKNSLINLQQNLETFGDSLTVIERTKINANAMKFEGQLNSKHSEFKAKENISFESVSTSDFHTVKLEAGKAIKNIKNSHMTGTNLDLNAVDFDNHGSIGIDKFSVHATSMLNAGDIHSEQLQLKVNHDLVNMGDIYSKNIKIQAATFLNTSDGRVNSSQSTVIQAPLVVNLGSRITSDGTLSIDSLACYNVFGLVQAYDLNNRSIHNYNYGLILPKLPKSYNDVFSVSRWVNYASMTLNQCVPQYSNVVSMGKMAVPHLLKSGSYLRDFWKSGRPISTLPGKIYNSTIDSCHEFAAGFNIKESSDVLPVMMNAMSTTLGAIQFAKSAAGAYKEINPDSYKETMVADTSIKIPPIPPVPKSTEELVRDTICSLGSNAISAFGPSMNIQSLYSNNAGVVLSANLTESTTDENNTGIKFGWNVVGNYKRGTNRGIFAGANVVATGDSYENFGSFTGFNKASLLFNESLTNAEGGSLNLTNFHIRTANIDNNSELNLSKGKLEADNLTSTGTANLSGVAAIIKEDVNLKGSYSLTDQTSLNAKEINLADEGLIKQSVISSQGNLNQTGHLVSEESYIAGKNVKLSGIEAIDGKICAENDLNISNSSTLGTGLAADNAYLKDSTFKGRKAEKLTEQERAESQYTEEKATSSANKIDVKDKLITKNIVVEDMQIESGSYKDTGSRFKESNIKIAKDFTATNTAFDQTIAQAENISLSGKTTATSSQLIADNNLKQTGNCKTKDTNLVAKNVSADGLDATGGKIIAKEKLDINHSKTLGTGIGAKNANLKNSTFKGKKTAQSEGKIENEETPIEQSNQNPNCDPAANQIKVTEKLTTYKILMEDMQVESDSYDDFGSKCKESNIKIAKSYSAKNTTFDQAFVEAENIYLQGKTTAVSSQLIADNNLKQTGNCKTKDTTLAGKNVNADGLDATGGKIIAKEQLDINHSKTSGTGIGAKNANLKNSTFKGEKITESEEKIENTEKITEESNQNPHLDPAANQIKVEEKLSTDNVVMEDIQLISTRHEDEKGTYKSTHASAQTFNGKDSQFENSSYQSKVISLAGKTKVTASQLYAENKLTQRGHLVGEEALLSSGGTTTLDGIELNKSFIQSKHKLEVKNAKTIDSGLSAETMHLQDSTFKASSPPKEENTSEKTPTSTEETTVDSTEKNANEISDSNQIKAGKKITTNNVVFEGQFVGADAMSMNKSQMKDTHAKINKNFDSTDNVINKSCIESNKANFKGNNSLSNTLVKTKESIVFEKQGHLKTHDCEFDGGKTILHKSANHEQTGNLLFKADDVQTTASTHLYSGKGKNNTLYVQAKTGNFQGAMDLDNGNFDVKKLKNAEDLIGKKGQSKKQNFSKSLSLNIGDAVNLAHVKPRDCDISIRAKEIKVETDYKSKHDVTLIASEGDVTVNANVSGDKVVLKSEKANIDVIGKTVEGKTYVYAEAKKDINVRATERHFKGKYSTEVEYTQAQIIGGSGNKDTGGAGVILKAHNKAIVDASNVVAVGKAVVSGDKGVELKARSHAYVSERKERTKRVCGIKHGKKKTETTTAKISVPTLGSLENQVQVVSLEGRVGGEAGNFVAAKGTDIYSYKDINLKSLITETKTKKRETGCFGLNSKKKNKKHENVKLVDFISKGGETRLHARTGNIKGTDLCFQGAGHVRFETPKGSIFLKSSKLNHSIHTRERKVSVSSPIVNAAKRATRDKKRFVKQAEPIVGQAEMLTKSKTPLEKIAAASNLAVSGYNAACALAEGTYALQLMQGMGFTPKIDISISQTKSSSHYQTGTGAGIFVDGDVTFLAKDQIDLEGMPIIANNLGMKGDKIGMRGHGFESSYSKKSTTVTVGVSPTGGVTDASCAHSAENMKAIHYQNMQVQIKNKVTIEARLMEMDAANINCDKINAKIDKVTITSMQDELEHSVKNYSASTTGAVSMQQSDTHSRQVNQAAGIHVTSDIAKDDIKIKEINLNGSALTTDGHNGFEPDKLITKTVKDSSHTRGFGISGNVNAIANSLDSDCVQTAQLTTFSVSHVKRDYSAENQATIYGKDGVSENLKNNHPHLNTTSAQSKRVTHDRAENITLEVPVEIVKSSVKAGIQFFKPAELKEHKIPVILKEIAELQMVTSPVEEVGKETYEGFDYVSETSSVPETFETNPQTDQNSYIPAVEIEEKTVDSINPIVEPVELINANSEIETSEPCGTFNPDLQMQTLGMKKGRHGNQLCNKDSAQYTNIEKELEISNDRNQITYGVEVPLMAGGDKTGGLYYSATVDPLTNTFTIDAGLGVQHVFNLYSDNVDLGAFGTASFRIDACSAQAFINTKMEITPCSASATVGGALGLMGPSASGSYNTPTFSFMGLTFQLTTEVSGGLGVKIEGRVGAEADARRMKISGVAKIGFFSGAGANLTIKPSVGLDLNSIEEHTNAVKEMIENDPCLQGTSEKWKNYEAVSQWEREEYYDAIERANAQVTMSNVQKTISGWLPK